MQAQWIFSSTFLPYTGEPIEFLLEDRKQPIHGTFANGIFRSRWADYGADRVASWRKADGDPSAEPIEMPHAVASGTFMATLKRLGRALSTSRRAAPIKPTRSHSRLVAAQAIMVRPPAAATRRFDSVEFSS
jgi:hypothetical protein